jgi:hypothetical protein
LASPDRRKPKSSKSSPPSCRNATTKPSARGNLPPLPVTVAEDDDVVPAGESLLLGKIAAGALRETATRMPPNRRTRRAGGIRRKHRHHLPPGEIADGLKLAAAGLVLGLSGAFYGTKLLQSSLYGMRAASVDPLRSLRE